MPVPYRPAHPPYIPATPSSSHIQTHTSMQSGTGGQVHVHHHHHTYHHNQPTPPPPSSPHSQQFPDQARSRPYYHPHPHPAMGPIPGRPPFGYGYAPRPLIPPMAIPMGPPFVAPPFFFPFPGHPFAGPGRGEEGGTGSDEQEEEAEESEDRERAFPPSGPRLFNGVPPRAYSRGFHFHGARPTHRGRNGPKGKPRDGFEVHHPDGTVEYEEEGPRVEEMSTEGEDAWDKAQARWRQEQGDYVDRGQDDAVVSGNQGEEPQLMIEWDRPPTLPPPSSPIVLVKQDPQTVSPGQAAVRQTSIPILSVQNTSCESEWQFVSPQPSPPLATTSGTREAGPSLQTPAMTRSFQLSPGTQAPKGTPEASPVLAIFPDSGPSGHGVPVGGGNPARELREDVSHPSEKPDQGHYASPQGKGASRSLPVRLEMAERISSELHPVIDNNKRDEIKQQETLDRQSKGTPTLTMVADHRNPATPVSASLLSPEPAQVLDRLLEVTGLSARQFMIMLERGDFKVEDVAHVRATTASGSS